MLEFLEDNIDVVFARKVFKQMFGIPIGTNCAPPLAIADIHICSVEGEFIQYLGSSRVRSMICCQKQPRISCGI